MKDLKIDLLDAALNIHTLLNKAEHEIRHLEYDKKQEEKCLLQLIEVHECQGQKGSWDISPYHTGLFNGLELALSIFEKRKPEYREHPNAVIGSGQKPTKHLDDVLGASEYILDRGKVFQEQLQYVKTFFAHGNYLFQGMHISARHDEEHNLVLTFDSRTGKLQKAEVIA